MQCPNCLAQMNATKWHPPSGIDQTMLKYECPKCGEVKYAVLPKPKKIQGVTF